MLTDMLNYGNVYILRILKIILSELYVVKHPEINRISKRNPFFYNVKTTKIYITKLIDIFLIPQSIRERNGWNLFVN